MQLRTDSYVQIFAQLLTYYRLSSSLKVSKQRSNQSTKLERWPRGLAGWLRGGGEIRKGLRRFHHFVHCRRPSMETLTILILAAAIALWFYFSNKDSKCDAPGTIESS